VPSNEGGLCGLEGAFDFGFVAEGFPVLLFEEARGLPPAAAHHEALVPALVSFL